MSHERVSYALDADAFERVWPTFSAMVATGDTYSYTQDLDMATARALWSPSPARTYVAEQTDEVACGYPLKPNPPGSDRHVELGPTDINVMHRYL